MEKTLVSFGHGYSAAALARVLIPQGWTIYGTTRSQSKFDDLRSQGVIPVLWGSEAVKDCLETCQCVLTSVAPDDAGDPVLALYADSLARNAARFTWVGYLSTTGVYGDRKGGWVDESSELQPSTKRGQLRQLAEGQWREIADLPLHIFRLAGIYGPGRGPFAKVRNGTAQRIIKKDQVFSRIHVDDIAQTLSASIQNPKAGAIYNVCDDDPAPPQDVIGYAADLLGMPQPPEVDFENADLSPMARSFYAESKRVSNERIKAELGVDLFYPDFRSGLRKMLQDQTD